MNITRDFRILKQLLAGSGGGDHAERLERFYAEQAEDYDAFRERLLPGRRELLGALPLEPGALIVDMGGGTGANLEFLPAAAHEQIARWSIVDLSPSLLNIARRRAQDHGWQHVELHEADATTFDPGRLVDVVLFSYSLTMIPDWMGALEQAHRILKPGGHVALVDFTVSRKYPPDGLHQYGAFARHFWPLWFSWDNVFLNADHLPWLLRTFTRVRLVEATTRLPYVPGSKVPYYQFLGRK